MLTIWWVLIGVAHAYKSSVTRCRRRSGEDGSYARTRVSMECVSPVIVVSILYCRLVALCMFVVHNIVYFHELF